MLGMKTYPKEYIEACRARVDSDLAAYSKLAAGAGNAEDIERFEARFFNNMTLVLDHSFVHRLRMVEGKDGNALNEVRMLSDSILLNKNRLCLDGTIKYVPAKSVLKLEPGAEIRLKEADFARLSAAFFAEMFSKFAQD